tara:strand:- start:635 stop:1423 length:789 start_codon:yes stop_codon:yes gene_type:complete
MSGNAKFRWFLLAPIVVTLFVCVTSPAISWAVELKDAQKLLGSKVVVLDSGHNPKNGGTTSHRGIKEVTYNDNIVDLIKDKLKTLPFLKVVLTRKRRETISLKSRTQISKNNLADLFLSIHHDSAQEIYLDRVAINGKRGWKTIKPIKGYSIFISKKNNYYDKSLEFAQLLGEEMIMIKRHPTLHHSEKIQGENRYLLNEHLGIYHYDNLFVLKNNYAPSVLFEIGVVVDPEDENYIIKKENQTKIVNGIASALEKFFKNNP